MDGEIFGIYLNEKIKPNNKIKFNIFSVVCVLYVLYKQFKFY